MAFYGMGLWALVAFTLTNVLFTIIIMSLYSEYKLRIHFEYSRFKTMFSFCGNILLSSLISGFGDTLRTLVIGKKYDKDDLAYYDKAYSYSSFFTQIITSSIASILLPVFSRSQENLSELLSMARRSVRITAFFIIPFLTLIIAVSSPFVHLFLTEKWMPCVPFLIIFCILRMPGCISSIDKQVYFALGNSKLNLYYELFLLIANIIMLLVTIPFGVLYIALGYLFVELLGCVALFIVSSKIFGYSIWMRVCDIWKPILSSIIMISVISFPLFQIGNDWLNIGTRCIVGIIVFVLLEFLLKDENLEYIFKIMKQQITK